MAAKAKAPSEDVVKKLVDATGLKLSAADMKKLRAGDKVSLDNYTLADFGAMLLHADASRRAEGEERNIKDLLTGGGTGGAVPRIRVKCVTIRNVRCCLVASWPPYIGIECSGTF